MKKRASTAWLSVVVTAGLGSAATPGFADNEIAVRIWTRTTGGCTSPCAPQPYCESFFNAAPATIQITVDSCTKQINIFAVNGLSHIGPVQITAPVSIPADLYLFIGSGNDFPLNGEVMPVAAGNLTSLSIGPPLPAPNPLRDATRFAGHIGGNLVTFGAFVGYLYRFDVDGVVQVPITGSNSPGPNLFRVHAGSTGTEGAINCLSGTMSFVQIAGECGGPIAAPGGGIDSIIVGGNLRRNVSARDFINNIDVSGNIVPSGALPVGIGVSAANAPIGVVKAASMNANIVAGPENPPGQRGDIKQVKTTSGGFSGLIIGRNLQGTALGVPALDIAGDLAANVTVHGSVDRPTTINGVLAPDKTIQIHESLTPNAPITITNATGLQGQIIINANGADGVWSGNVTVGSTHLSPVPSYTNLPASLGGGAVGLAGFNFHAQACSPVHLSAVWPPPASVIVDHYGPVIENVSGPPPVFKIEHRPIGSGTENWTDQTAQFSMMVESVFPFRHVTVTPTTGNSFLASKEYRIQPQFESGTSGMTALRCRYPGPFVGVVVYDYRFFTVPPYDMNGDGSINSIDVAVWPTQPRDFNADSAANFVDLQMLVQAASP